jgi:stress response protein YsnF
MVACLCTGAAAKFRRLAPIRFDDLATNNGTLRRSFRRNNHLIGLLNAGLQFGHSESCMYGQNLVAVYSSRSQAEAARSRLLESGIPSSDIRLSVERGETSAAADTATAATQGGGFLDWLFGSDVPESDRSWYGSNLSAGRTALSVHLHDEDNEAIADILEEFDPVEIEGAEGQSGAGLSTTPPAPDFAQGPESVAGGAAREGDQVIPVVKEQLDVGKRETERRYRVRTYTVERPVEQGVSLRDERVVIERRPASGAAANLAGNATGEAFQEREFEVVERHEEPLVAKRAGAAEEVIIHKEVGERQETVRDTVRETKVDIDRGAEAGRTGVAADLAAAGDKPMAPGQRNRKP